jgi:hypothetical protein
MHILMKMLNAFEDLGPHQVLVDLLSKIKVFDTLLTRPEFSSIILHILPS